MGPMEYIELGCVALAAFIMAGDEALRHAPNAAAFVPRLRGSWRFFPAAFVSVAALLVIFQNLGLPPYERVPRVQMESAEKTAALERANQRIGELQKQLASVNASPYALIPPISANVVLELIQNFRTNTSTEYDQKMRRIFITSPKNQIPMMNFLKNFLYILQSSGTFLVYDAPDPAHWVDAPTLETPITNGIVIHGTDGINNTIESALQRCFFIRRDTKPLAPEVASKLIELSGFSKEDIILWVAIGSESPAWKDPPVCIQ